MSVSCPDPLRAAALPVFAQPVDDTASRDHCFPFIADGGAQLYEEPLAPIQVSEGDESFWAARTPIPLRTASEAVILDPQGNEVRRQALPNLYGRRMRRPNGIET